ncbi:MAG TPA: glycosyltransferase [Mariprofundaceae bacterium]|nr:glycosyltransferase [Mariprofundaceae bacterium]
MRILMVSDVYFPRINGVSTAIDTYRRTLLDEGIEVRLVAPDYGEGQVDEEWIRRVPSRQVPLDPEDRIMQWSPLLEAVADEASRCELIHIQTPFLAHYAAVKVAKAMNLPLVSSYHTLFEDYFKHYIRFLPASWLKALARRISRNQCNAVDSVIAPSRALERRLREYGVSRPIQVLPTGIPLSRFNSGDGKRFRLQHGIDEGRPVALFVGRVAHEKNIGFLLESVDIIRRRMPEVLLVITGQGPAEAHLKAEVARRALQENVLFVGYLDRARELPDCYAAANAFVFASRTETQGLVLIEAMAMGVPVVALSSMGTTDILEAQRGAMVPDDDPEAFAITLAGLFGDPDLQARLAQEAREHARLWDETQLAKRLAAVYR